MIFKFSEFLNEYVTQLKIPYIQEIRNNEELSFKFINFLANEFGEELDLGNFKEKDPFLGAGGWGSAFELKGGRVLKITEDVKEATVAWRLSKKPVTKYLVNYYDVREITLKNFYYPNHPRLTVYAIILDKIKTLRGMERGIWASYEIFFQNQMTPQSYAEAITTSLDLKDVQFSVIELVEKYWKNMVEMRKEIKKLRLDNLDFYGENFGKLEDGTIVHFDIRDYDATKKFFPNFKEIIVDLNSL